MNPEHARVRARPSVRGGGALWGLALLSMLATPGCTRRSDAETRRAWEKSVQQAESGRPGAGGPGNGGPGAGPGSTPAYGWARVREVIEDAVEIMAFSPDAKTFARLAQKWCTIEPEPLRTEHGVVRVCNPSPPVRVDRHRFTLELGAIGVIGLVVVDLSDAEARQLAGRARTETQRWCSSDFRSRAPTFAAPEGTPRRAETEVHTCTVEGGSTLAVARLPQDDGTWVISISVLAAT